MFKFAGILVLFLLAGCSATPPSGPGPSAPVNWSADKSTPTPADQKKLVHVTPIGVASNLPPTVVHSNSPSITNLAKPVIAKPAPVITWTSLARWAAEQKISAPHRFAESPMVEYAIASKNGTLILGIGSREATWHGTEINLGFAPEIIDGEVFIHGLDLQKNIAPLLCGELLDFTNSHHVIVLDPGHGGMNSGTISVLDKRPEKEFTLDWARRLKPLLESNGWTVFMTRTNDTDLALSNRVAFTEAHHADCFISLHFNSAAPDKKENGLETYCLTPTGMPSTITRGFADPWFENLPNNGFDGENLQLATRVHGAVLHASGEEDRGVRRARFIGVLRGQKRPAILIEGGYLSNPAEATRIENPAFRQKLAEAVASALKNEDRK